MHLPAFLIELLHRSVAYKWGFAFLLLALTKVVLWPLQKMFFKAPVVDVDAWTVP